MPQVTGSTKAHRDMPEWCRLSLKTL